MWWKGWRSMTSWEWLLTTPKQESVKSMVKHMKDFSWVPRWDPASDRLLKVCNPEKMIFFGKLLPMVMVIHFHHTVAQLLFMSGRVHRGMFTVHFLPHYQHDRPGKDDWEKLKWVLNM